MTPRLSICIATLNRADCLRETLAGIALQAGTDVEVVVVDGGSTDNTQAVVDEFRSRLSWLICRRQNEPGGFDRDFDAAVAAASAEYCWLMSDDDALRPGALAAVLERLAGEPLSAIIVNAAVVNEDLTTILRARAVEVRGDRTYAVGDSERLFVDTGNYLSFIGAVVVRRALWMSRARVPYFGTMFVHVGVLFQMPLPEPAVLLAEPLIAIRYGHAQWTPRAFEIWMFKWPDVIWSFAHFSVEARERVCRRAPWTRLRTLLLYRATGAYSMREYRRWLAPRMQSPVRRGIATAIAWIPVTAANLVVSLAVHVLSRDPGVVLVDLRKSRYTSLRCVSPR